MTTTQPTPDDRERLRECVIACRDRFLEYADSHSAKAKKACTSADRIAGEHRAARNYDMAQLCHDALGQPPSPEAPPQPDRWKQPWGHTSGVVDEMEALLAKDAARQPDRDVEAVARNALEDALGFIRGVIQGPSQRDGIIRECEAAILALTRPARDAEQMREIAAWRECALYDATMEGPRFKGWDRSAMDRCRRRFIETHPGELKGDGNG